MLAGSHTYLKEDGTFFRGMDCAVHRSEAGAAEVPGESAARALFCPPAYAPRIGERVRRWPDGPVLIITGPPEKTYALACPDWVRLSARTEALA